MRGAKFELGDMVYLVTDRDQYQRIVTGIIFRPNCISYELSCGDETREHYDIEMSNEVNELIKCK